MARKKAAAKVEDLDLEDDDFDMDEEDVEEETTAKSKAKGKAKAKPKAKKEAAPKGIGARQLAERLKAEPKTFRAWLRRKVSDGTFPELAAREGRTRYDFGMEWTDPLIVSIMEAWSAESHERGAGLKKAQAAKSAKAGSKSKKKAPAKKEAVVEDDDDDDDLEDDED